MSKQTAVEYLIQYIMNNQYFIGNDLADVFVKAKEIEREQIENAWHAGVSDSDDCKSYYNERYRATSEKYYNKTYKGGQQ